jgi:hypothetical protein
VRQRPNNDVIPFLMSCRQVAVIFLFVPPCLAASGIRAWPRNGEDMGSRPHLGVGRSCCLQFKQHTCGSQSVCNQFYSGSHHDIPSPTMSSHSCHSNCGRERDLEWFPPSHRNSFSSTPPTPLKCPSTRGRTRLITSACA